MEEVHEVNNLMESLATELRFCFRVLS